MQRHDPQETALGDLRVLEVADEKGMYCGKLLADLGADVVKIERPGGDATRTVGPFYHDEPHPEKSLYFFFNNTNKRGITLNLETPDGRAIFRRLVGTADVLIETYPPGHLAELGLDYASLRELNPRLIMISITPFGQTGPYRNFKATDIVGLAMAGNMYLCGFPDRAPLSYVGTQAYNQASVHAAMALSIALYHRDVTGEGQHIDVSMQESCLLSVENAMPTYDMKKEVRKRSGEHSFLGTRTIYPCKDGYIHGGVARTGRRWQDLVAWMDGKGMAGDLKDSKYEDQQYMLDHWPHVEELVTAFYMTMTKQEAYHEGQARRILIGPVNTVKDAVENEQLAYREFFVEVEHPELGDTLTYPGRPYMLTETPWRILRRAPLMGEHNEEIYEQEMGFTKQQMVALRAAGVI